MQPNYESMELKHLKTALIILENDLSICQDRVFMLARELATIKELIEEKEKSCPMPLEKTTSQICLLDSHNSQDKQKS